VTPDNLRLLHYLPLSTTSFTILVAGLVVLFVLIQLGILRYAYMRLGLSSRAALLLLVASLIGSFINIPVAQLPGEQFVSAREVTYFGMTHAVPAVVDWPGTIIAVNVGGALLPTLTSLYLLAMQGLWWRGLAATAFVAAICHWLAQPVPGMGIALPTFVPSIATAIVAWLLSARQAAPLAYVAGTMGTLIGADLLNLDKIQGLGAPVASIGGAGTFDGIFIVGIVAVLIASLSPRVRRPPPLTRPDAGQSGRSDSGEPTPLAPWR
jgi:uncharacterized membrane protein